VGRNYTADARLSHPLDSSAIAERIARTSGVDGRERMLEQELLLALDGVARRDPGLLKGILTLQLSQLLLLLTSELAAEDQLSQDEAFEALCSSSPHRIRDRLRQLLSDVEHARAALQRGEQLHVTGRVQWKVPDPIDRAPQRRRLAAAPHPAWFSAEGAQGFLCRHLVVAAALPRPGGRRQAGTPQSTEQPPDPREKQRGKRTSPPWWSICSAESRRRNIDSSVRSASCL
jgi:hypothetical protein